MRPALPLQVGTGHSTSNGRSGKCEYISETIGDTTVKTVHMVDVNILHHFILVPLTSAPFSFLYHGKTVIFVDRSSHFLPLTTTASAAVSWLGWGKHRAGRVSRKPHT